MNYILSLVLEKIRLGRRNNELVVELMRKSADLSEANEEIRRLRGLIETHRDQTGHNMCWMNDVRLWRDALGTNAIDYPHEEIPPKEEFELGCRVYCASYYDSRIRPVKTPENRPEI